jgi:mono/diheme cytochrome c family protein
MRGPLILFALFALAGPAAAQDQAQRDHGAALTQRFCAGCHAIGRNGKSPNPAAPPFRELHRRYSIDNLAEALAEGMLVGHPAMPEFQFQPQDIRAIISYLKSIQTDQQARLDAVRGR